MRPDRIRTTRRDNLYKELIFFYFVTSRHPCQKKTVSSFTNSYKRKKDIVLSTKKRKVVTSKKWLRLPHRTLHQHPWGLWCPSRIRLNENNVFYHTIFFIQPTCFWFSVPLSWSSSTSHFHLNYHFVCCVKTKHLQSTLDYGPRGGWTIQMQQPRFSW